MTNSSVGADLDETPDVLSDLFSQISFNAPLILNHLSDAASLFFRQVLDLDCRFDLGCPENLARPSPSDAVDIGQTDPDLFARRQIDSCYSRHGYTLPLSLLVFGVLTDHPNDTVAPDDLALWTHSLD